MRFTSNRVVPWATRCSGQADGQAASIPTYNLSWGLRTVDGSYNHLLPGQEQWGAADHEFPELLRRNSAPSRWTRRPGGVMSRHLHARQ